MANNKETCEATSSQVIRVWPWRKPNLTGSPQRRSTFWKGLKAQVRLIHWSYFTVKATNKVLGCSLSSYSHCFFYDHDSDDDEVVAAASAMPTAQTTSSSTTTAPSKKTSAPAVPAPSTAPPAAPISQNPKPNGVPRPATTTPAPTQSQAQAQRTTSTNGIAGKATTKKKNEPPPPDPNVLYENVKNRIAALEEAAVLGEEEERKAGTFKSSTLWSVAY